MSAQTYTTDRLGVPQRIQTYDSQGGANSGVIVAGPATILRLRGVNIAASGTLWLMVFDALAVPANASIPLVAPVPIAGGAVGDFDLNGALGSSGLLGLRLSKGLVWAASTTAASLTVDATSSLWVTTRHYV